MKKKQKANNAEKNRAEKREKNRISRKEHAEKVSKAIFLKAKKGGK